MKKQKFIFQNVVVMGLGLIGGSFALELRKQKLAAKVIGVSRSLTNRQEALRRKAVDEAYPQIAPFIKEADLILLATPVESIRTILKQIKPFLSKETLITDVGSSKQKIVQEAKRLGIHQFVGGHPIAGTEKSGMKAAELNLFQKRKWILTPSKKHPALGRLKLLLKKIGAEVLKMKADEHDKILAAVSHLPNLLAYSLAAVVGEKDRKQKIKLAALSLKEMTRVASSPPEMWRDICLSNATEISKTLAAMQKNLGELKKAVDRKNSKKLMSLLEKGRCFRKELEK